MTYWFQFLSWIISRRISTLCSFLKQTTLQCVNVVVTLIASPQYIVSNTKKGIIIWLSFVSNQNNIIIINNNNNVNSIIQVLLFHAMLVHSAMQTYCSVCFTFGRSLSLSFPPISVCLTVGVVFVVVESQGESILYCWMKKKSHKNIFFFYHQLFLKLYQHNSRWTSST